MLQLKGDASIGDYVGKRARWFEAICAFAFPTDCINEFHKLPNVFCNESTFWKKSGTFACWRFQLYNVCNIVASFEYPHFDPMIVDQLGRSL